MRKRRRRDDLERILAAQDLQRLAARHALGEALSLQTARKDEEDAADGAVRDLVAYWSTRLEQRALDPQTIGGVGAAMASLETDLETARRQHETARSEADASKQSSAIREAQVAHSARLLKRARRQLDVLQEEKRLAALDERTTYRWVRP